MATERGEVLVLPASNVDLEDIAAIAAELYPSTFQAPNPRELAYDWVRDHYARGKFSQILVAEEDRTVAGYSISSANAASSGVISVIEWGVAPQFGGRGFGQRVIDGTEKYWATEHPERFSGQPLTAMLVFTGDRGARVCEKMGYARASTLPGLYGAHDEIIMRKNFPRGGNS